MPKPTWTLFMRLLAVRKLAVEKCDQDKPDQFEKVFEVGECACASPPASPRPSGRPTCTFSSASRTRQHYCCAAADINAIPYALSVLQSSRTAGTGCKRRCIRSTSAPSTSNSYCCRGTASLPPSTGQWLLAWTLDTVGATLGAWTRNGDSSSGRQAATLDGGL